MDALKISEIFGPTVQGEGALIGRPTVFVRTGGCDFRCSWCDTLYAVESRFNHQWQTMTSSEVFEKIESLSGGSPILVTLSGGNPALQPLDGLIRLGRPRGYTFAIETQGSIAKSWFTDLDFVTLSPKPPSSDMPFDPVQLQNCIDAAGEHSHTSLKIVVADEQDFYWAREVAARYPQLPCYLQPCNLQTDDKAGAPTAAQSLEQLEWLTGLVTESRWHGVTVLPQLHLLMWPGQPGR